MEHDRGRIAEARLCKKAILEAASRGWRLLFWEYDIVPGATQCGRGDLLFQSGPSTFVGVEVKVIGVSKSRGYRSKKRRHVRQQAQRYAGILAHLFPGLPDVYAATMTDEAGLSFPMCVTREETIHGDLCGEARDVEREIRVPSREGTFVGQRAVTVGGGYFKWSGARWVPCGMSINKE